MGIHTEITKTVFCDVGGCHNWEYSEFEGTIDIVTEFRKLGWRFRDGKFTCPDCLAQEEKEDG